MNVNAITPHAQGKGMKGNEGKLRRAMETSCGIQKDLHHEGREKIGEEEPFSGGNHESHLSPLI